MEPQYWAGIATGLGWGTCIGLTVALVVALWLKRLAPPNEREPYTQHHGSNIVPAQPRYGQ